MNEAARDVLSLSLADTEAAIQNTSAQRDKMASDLAALDASLVVLRNKRDCLAEVLEEVTPEPTEPPVEEEPIVEGEEENA